MAFPAVQDISSGIAGRVTSHPITLPSGINVGDLLLVFFATDGDISISNWDGFTELFSVDNGTSASLSVGYKIATGSDTLTITTNESEESSHVCYRITGHNTTQMPEVSGGVTGDDGSPDPDLLTPTGGAKDYLWIAVEGNDHTDTVSGWPTSFALYRTSKHGLASGSCNVGVCGSEVNVSSKNPSLFNLYGSEEWIACTIAVHPTSGPATNYQNAGQGAIAPTGILIRKTSKDMGGYAIGMVGSLAAASMFNQAVGGGSLSPTGILSRAATFVKAVGGYALGIVGVLGKMTSKYPGSGSVSPVGSLARGQFEDVGGGNVSSTGIVATASIFFQAIGDGVIAPIGTLSSAVTFICTAGQHALSITGSLVKQTFKDVGGGVMSIAGSLARKALKNVGSGSVAMAGTASAAFIAFQSVGGYAVGIIGSLATQFTAGGGPVAFLKKIPPFILQSIYRDYNQ